MNDNLPSLHSKANDSLVRLLSNRVRDMRGGAGDIGTPAEAPTGRASVPADAAGQVNAPANPNGSESGGVKP